MKTADFHYLNDGMFYSIFPVSKDAEACYQGIIQAIGFKMLPHIFAGFKAQAKASGYCVRKSPRVSVSDEELLAELLA